MNIRELMNSGMQVNITVSVADLKEFALTLVDEVRAMDAEALAQAAKEDRTLTPHEAAKVLGVSENTLWRWEKTGYLVPHSRIGKRPVYLQSQIDALR